MVTDSTCSVCAVRRGKGPISSWWVFILFLNSRPQDWQKLGFKLPCIGEGRRPFPVRGGPSGPFLASRLLQRGRCGEEMPAPAVGLCLLNLGSPKVYRAHESMDGTSVLRQTSRAVG